MKKIITVLALVLTVVMLLSLSACGGESSKPAEVTEELPVVPAVTEAPAKEESADSNEPAANVDPAVVNMGQAIDEKHTADAWYKDGVEGGDYIYFELADNSDLGLAYVKMENGERVSTVLCTVNADLHVVDAEAEAGESSIDLVFVDNFKAYDYKSGTWYVRGDPATLSTIFADVAFVNQDDDTNTLILRADGTGTELFQGQEDELTWEMDSATTVKYNDGSYDHVLQIVCDETGNLISLSEQNFRIFVPAEAAAE